MIRRPFVPAVLAATGVALAACGGGQPAARPTHTATVTAPASRSVSAAQAASTSPASQPASQAPAAAAACLSRYLNGSIGLTQCTLYGYPGVAQATGTPVTDVGLPSSENPSTARELVTLAPGGYANATLQIADAGNFSGSACTQVPANWLAVIPPNQQVPLYIPYNSTACKGSAKLLTVTAVRPGNGG